MARPALPADQRKNVKIEVYVTPPWFEAVTASAAKAKTDVSNYIRSCVERIQAKEAKKEQKAPPAAKPKVIDRQEVIFDFIDDLEAVPDDDEEGEPWK